MTGRHDDSLIHFRRFPTGTPPRTFPRRMALRQGKRPEGQVVPPADWGRHWTWNVTEDGTGIYFKRAFE